MEGYVALGSNLGDREGHLRRGLLGMARRGVLPVSLSSVWETEPVGTDDPLWFLNMAARVRTQLRPLDVLRALLAVEAEAGRVRRGRNAPRELDLDLLTLGALRKKGPLLTLPHPRMWERRFVLAPLAELAPGLRNPRTGRTIERELEELRDRHEVRRRGELAFPIGGPV